MATAAADPLATLANVLLHPADFPDLPKFLDCSGNQVIDLQSTVFVELANGLIFEKTVPVPYKNRRTMQNFTLEAILYCYQEKKENFVEYSNRCRAMDFPLVGLLERKDILAFLAGERDRCDANDPTYVQPIPFKSFDDLCKRKGLKQYTPKAAPQEPVSKGEPSKRPRPDPSRKSPAAPSLKEPIKQPNQTPGSSRSSYAFLLPILKEVCIREKEEKKQAAERSVTAPLKGVSHSMLADIKTSTDTKNAQNAPHGQTKEQARRRILTPIVIVPASYSTMVNMFNVKQFLEKAAFVTSQSVRELGVRKEAFIPVTRENFADGKSCTVTVVDNINRLRPEDWENVVAVFVQGEQWQFKGWQWDTPEQLFSHILGFYVGYDDDKADVAAARWKSVEVLRVGRTNRSRDVQAVNRFWKALLDYCLQKSISLVQ